MKAFIIITESNNARPDILNMTLGTKYIALDLSDSLKNPKSVKHALRQIVKNLQLPERKKE